MRTRFGIAAAIGFTAAALMIVVYWPSPVIAGSRACVRVSAINDWRALNDSNMVVWRGKKTAFHLVLSGTCPGLERAHTVAFRDNDNDRRICGMSGDYLVLRDMTDRRCLIRTVESLSEGELNTLLEKYGKLDGEVWEPDEPQDELPEEDASEER